MLAIPTMITMMVTAIYNMADTFFVSQLGTSASGAIGVVFSDGNNSGGRLHHRNGQRNHDFEAAWGR